jgi:hypothetical protein
MMMALSLHVEHSEIKSDREHKPHQHPAPRCSRLPAPIACGRRGCCARYTSPLTNVASAGRAPGRSKRRRKRSARFRRIGRSPRALRPAIAPAPEASRDRAATSQAARSLARSSSRLSPVGDPGQRRLHRGRAGNGRGSGIEVAKLEIRRAQDIAPAFQALQRQADALYLVVDGLVAANRTPIITFALAAYLPTMFNIRDYVEAGRCLGKPTIRRMERR